MITQQSIRQAMTRQQVALERVKNAYHLNNIPVPTRDERHLGRLSSTRLEALADYWEQRFAESRKEAACEGKCNDEEDEPAGRFRSGMPPGIPRLPDGEPNLLHPSCPISVIQKVLRRMSGLHGPHPQDHILTTDRRFHGYGASGIHRVE